MQRWIDKNTKWILTLPLILFILIMVAYPLYYTFDLSLHTSTMSAVKPPKFVGLANYEKMFRNSRFIDSCEKTLLFSGVCLIDTETDEEIMLYRALTYNWTHPAHPHPCVNTASDVVTFNDYNAENGKVSVGFYMIE